MDNSTQIVFSSEGHATLNLGENRCEDTLFERIKGNLPEISKKSMLKGVIFAAVGLATTEFAFLGIPACIHSTLPLSFHRFAPLYGDAFLLGNINKIFGSVGGFRAITSAYYFIGGAFDFTELTKSLKQMPLGVSKLF